MRSPTQNCYTSVCRLTRVFNGHRDLLTSIHVQRLILCYDENKIIIIKVIFQWCEVKRAFYEKIRRLVSG